MQGQYDLKEEFKEVATQRKEFPKQLNDNVRSNLDTHLSDTPFTIWQPIWRPHLLERVYKPIHTLHWCGVLQSSITESISDRV